ncbi:hypothetical protein Tco_0983156 [Tanacetum coccineum]
MRYGYIKNHKKAVKNGQARTRESEEYKAEARKVKPAAKSSHRAQSYVAMKKAQRDLGILPGITHTSSTKVSHQGLPAWQSV